MAKQKFIIEPHFRLHEWVAEEKGYFKDEGLDYEFRELVQSSDGASHQLGDKVGAMQTFERGRKSDVSCACHWTVNVAATKGHGKLYGLIEMRDAASARRLMDDHVKMIRARRVAEHGPDTDHCC